MFIFVS